MLENKLKLNSGRTQIIVFSSSYLPRLVLNNLVIAYDIQLTFPIFVKILGLFSITLYRWFRMLLLYASLTIHAKL